MSLPARFGRYTIERPLGHGGMGTVYLAQDELQRRVVVKVISPELARDPVAVERLRREAQAAARVSSPHVVRVHEFGVEAGTPFIAMEYVEGRSVQQVVTELGRIQPEHATKIVFAAAQGLRDVHAAGILHRDVKPANILLDGQGRVKLADFGICKVAKKGLEGSATISLAGEVLGSPDYMAPEQAEGKPLDGRADIYALGATYYQLLTGELPFHSTTAIATLARALNEKATPPRSIVPAIPAGVERACLKMMAREREQRPRDAEAVLALLRGIGRPSERVVQKKTTGVTKAAPRRASPVAALVAASLVVGGLGGLVAARATPAEPPKEAVAPAPPAVAPAHPIAEHTADPNPAVTVTLAPVESAHPPLDVKLIPLDPDPAPTLSAAQPVAPQKADVTPAAVVVTPASDAEAARAFAEAAAIEKSEILLALRAHDVDRAAQAARRLRAKLPSHDKAAVTLVDALDALAASLGALKSACAKLKKDFALRQPSEIFQALLDADRRENELKVGATVLAAFEKVAVPDLLLDRDGAKAVLEWLGIAEPRVDDSWTKAQQELDALDKKPVLERTELNEIHTRYPFTKAGRTAAEEWTVLKGLGDMRKGLQKAIHERDVQAAKNLKKPDTKRVPAAFEKEIKDVLAKLADVYKLVANLAAAMPTEFAQSAEDMQVRLAKSLGTYATPNSELAEAIIIVAAVDGDTVSAIVYFMAPQTTPQLLAALGVEKPDTASAKKRGGGRKP